MRKIFSLMLLVILISAFTGCFEDGRDTAEKYQKNMEITANDAVQIPEVKYFPERKTIARWSDTWNLPGVISYVYLVSYGKILGYYVVDGKPASTRSYLLPEESYYANGAVLSNPDIDGTYGENNQGIRFFTAEGIASEWAGDGACYLYSNAPINFGMDIPKLNPIIKK